MKNRMLQLGKQPWVIPIAILLIAFAASTVIVKSRTGKLATSTAHSQHFTYECEKNQSTSMACEQQHYAALVKTKGVPATFAELKKNYATDATVRANCHQLTHAIGRSAAEESEGVEDAFTKGDNFCSSGYYHGVMELMAKKVGTKNIEAKITTMCTALANKRRYSLEHYNCVHGLGHGVMTINNNELYDALHACDRLTDAWEASSCNSGVFMENIMAGQNPGTSTKYLKDDQPMYPCTAVSEQHKEPCYLIQTSRALTVVNFNYAKVFSLCSEAGSHAPTCYQSLGRDASGNSISDVTQTNATCSLGGTYEARDNCIIGAVKDFIYYYHNTDKVSELCTAVEPAIRDDCDNTTVEYAKSL